MGPRTTIKLVLVGGLSAAIAATVLAPPAVATSSGELEATRKVAALVDAATPGAVGDEDVPARRSAGGRFATTGATQVAIPATADGAVMATSPTGDATVSVQVGGASAVGTLATDGSVVFDQGGSTDATVQPTDDGFRIHTLIHDAFAPTRYAHQVTIPTGTRLVLIDGLPSQDKGTSPGGALILDAQGNLVAGFAPPWAVDAQGAGVPTHYELEGAALVQVIDHHAGTAYPVVADPYLGFDLVKGARWISRPGGPSLSVTPTGWARANIGSYYVGTLGWEELYSKYRDGGLNTNLGGMRDQYICHQQFAAFKPRWNLDQWRPDVSYPATVANGCNP